MNFNPLDWLKTIFGHPKREPSRAVPGPIEVAPIPVPPQAVAPAPLPRGERAAFRRFDANWLTWTVPRVNQPFRTYVFEPLRYLPATHAALFNAVLTRLISPPQEMVDPYEARSTVQPSDSIGNFDLVTFPEAFLPWADFVAFLTATADLPFTGCIHVGLRPSATDRQHMFRVEHLVALLVPMQRLPSVAVDDLRQFTAWLGKQPTDAYVNIGCLIAKDIDQRHRLCLHAKLVRSRYEFGAKDGRHMHESNLLSLVTLRPMDPSLLSTTIQPLLCSDALHLETDRPGGRPVPAYVRLAAEVLHARDQPAS